MSPRELGAELDSIDAVRDRILASLRPAPAETVALEHAHGRVLREGIAPAEPLPPFDNSAMDGYGVIAADLCAARSDSPVELELDAEIVAGDSRNEPISRGRTVRIMTGAPLPPGVEAVVPHEQTERDGSRVLFFGSVAPGKNVRRAGADLRAGDAILRDGQVLHSGRLAIAAALGRPRVRVTRGIRVAVISTGSELVPVESVPGPGQIRNSNAHAITAALRECGAEPVDRGIVADDLAALEDSVRAALAAGADAIITTGGVSAGDRDFVRDLVATRAEPGHVFRVAMRPGKPLAFGLFEGRPLFGLPGNPASAFVSFEMFVRPALRLLRGETPIVPPMFPIRVPFEYRYRGGRTFLLRGRAEPDPELGGYRLAPPEPQDSSFLRSMAANNVLVFLSGDRDRVQADEVLSAWWLSSARV